MANHELTPREHIHLVETYGAHNYHPLPVVIASAQGAWMTDVDGKRYFDCLAGYSALNFGHSHPRLVQRAAEQLSTLTLTSRAFYNDQMGPFAEALAGLTGKDMILPMNTGAEAVETAIKVSRRWGYQVKGVPPDSAQMIVMDGNFHGRTTTIVGFSDDNVARADFGPFTPGFDRVKYGMTAAIEEAITPRTVAVMLEPIQGEGGVLIPPDGYLREVRALCDEHGILMIADEVQSGLARTGRTFACDHENVVPDIYVMGKALGGGLYPVSAIAADRHIMQVIAPGSHGSTFGGNPLAAAIGREVVDMLSEGTWQQRSAELGDYLVPKLHALIGRGITAIRARGLWVGLDIDPAIMSGRQLCERLMYRGVLAKDTHGATIRLAPPLVASRADLDFVVSSITEVLGAE